LWLFNKVLGAFWYFLSIQRETACWHTACKNHTRCTSTSFNCNHPLSDLAFLNDYCQPIEKPNATFFDFGIFLGALQSGNLESTDFPQKLAYCFWWGLRNLRFGRDHTLDLLFNNSLSFLFSSSSSFFFFLTLSIYIVLLWYCYLIYPWYFLQFSQFFWSKPSNEFIFLGKLLRNFCFNLCLATLLVFHRKCAGRRSINICFRL
jgi:hypothetical protein